MNAAPAQPPAGLGPVTVLAALALLPFGRASELPLLFGALVGSAWLLRGRIDLRAPTTRLAALLFAGYWLPELLSAFDAVAPRKAWTEVATDLRYLPFMLFVARAWPADVAGALGAAARGGGGQHERGSRADRPAGWRDGRTLTGAALIVSLWLIDALLQAATGWSLGGPAESDRLSGIFGADLKLGGMLAVLSPLLLWPAWQRGRWLAALAFAALLVVVLLAGARAAWLGLALAVGLLLFAALPRRRAWLVAALLGAGALLAAGAGYQLSDRFAARVDRTAAALAGDPAALDHALSFRLPIWRAALSMLETHPVNGVGVRGFRHAYADHTAAGDRWLDFDDGAGAFHAHQWLLEVGAETGLLGLLCWFAAIAIGGRAWRAAGPAARRRAWPVSVALLVMLFPLNTHYAFYSSAWGGLLFVLLGWWVALIAAPTVRRPRL